LSAVGPQGEIPAGLQAARSALAGSGAFLVGGALRDRLLGRATYDVDVVVEGDTESAARAVARAGGPAACFELSRDFGAWRVSARDGSWQVDVEPMRGTGIAEDLAMRDFTINAMAEPIGGGGLIDPLGGAGDLRAGRLRMASTEAFEDDPLRVLRLARAAVELTLEPDAETAARAAQSASALRDVSAERVFGELRRIIAAPAAHRGLDMLSELTAAAVVLPELEALRGVEQNRYHHLDVHGHTLAVLDRTIELADCSGPFAHDLRRTFGEHSGEVMRLLAEPLADEMTRAEALRWGALLHDAAKPLTREVSPDGSRVTFMGHDIRGAELAREVLGRLRASERLRAHVAGLVRNHLRLGFLVHEPQPLSRRTVYRYMRTCAPVEVDVTLLSIADRLATRGDRAEDAIAAHLEVGEGVLADALAWRASPAPEPLIRGDELAIAVGIEPGPRLGRLLDLLAEERYAGELTGREDAIARAREMLRTI